MFVGHTRFSLFHPNSRAWVASNNSRFSTATEYEDYLYSPERLDLRTRIFVEDSLPQIEAASERHAIKHIVSYSERLPRNYQLALETAAERFPFLVLDCRSEAGEGINPVAVAKKLAADHSADSPETAFGIYRLDDDDILPIDYFRQMSKYVRPEFAGMHVSLPNGITVIYIDGEYYYPRQSYSAMHAFGLLAVHSIDSNGKLTRPGRGATSHSKTDRVSPVILDARQIGYMWVRHADQDTTLTYSPRNDDEMVRYIRERMKQFPAYLDSDNLVELFPRVANKIHMQSTPGLTFNDLLDSPVTLETDSIRGSVEALSDFVEVQVELDCGAGAVAKNALVSFDLRDSDGNPVDSSSMEHELRSAGLLRSGREDIGYFSYLDTPEGVSWTSAQFDLPSDITCLGVKLMKWRRSATDISVRKLSLSGRK